MPWTPAQLADVVDHRVYNQALGFTDRVMARLDYPQALRDAGLSVAVGEAIAALTLQAIVASAAEVCRVLRALPTEPPPGSLDHL